jgi:hypothetical protein
MHSNNHKCKQKEHSKKTMAEGKYNVYYQLFDDETNRGKVLDDDWSEQRWENEIPPIKKLTDSESVTRSTYSITIATLLDNYGELLCPEVKSLEEVLCQRVVAPCLISSKATSAVCTRSKHKETRASRKYPSKIRQWEEFADNVSKYRYKVPTEAEHAMNHNRYNSIFWESLDRAQWPVRDESGEKYNLFYNLRASLVKCGIVGEVCDGKDGCTGLVDFTLKNGEGQVTVICESKSTNNLLLPLDAEQCAQKYNEAYNKMYGANDIQEEGTYSPSWSMVCHPLGQLFGYMLDNKCPFGALTSGTRTYFVSISGNDVKISDAWFVGQQDYLRAWAYVHSLGCDPPEWIQLLITLHHQLRVSSRIRRVRTRMRMIGRTRMRMIPSPVSVPQTNHP